MNSIIRWQRPELTTWPGFGRLTDLRDEIDRLFDAPLTELARTAQVFGGWTPAIDMYEDKDNLYVRVEVPGMRKEDIEVSLHDGSLSISGERKAENRQEEHEVYRAERFYGRFQRTVSLPCDVSNDKVKAQYKDGILSVTLPKTEQAKPKHIEVNVN